MYPNNPNTPRSSNPQFDPSSFELNTQQRQFSPLDNTPPGGYVSFLNQGTSSSPIPQSPLFASSSPNMFSQPPQPQFTQEQFEQFRRWQLQQEFDRLQQQHQEEPQPPPQQPQPAPRRLKRTKAPAKKRGKAVQQSLIDEDDDVDFVAETQPPPPPPPSRKSGHWNEDEEETLMKAWIGISTDAKTGTDQSGKVFFQRVHERFCTLMGNPYHRSYDATNSKWRDMKKAITDFAGAFNKVSNQNASGSNQLDAYTTAGAIYKARNGNKEFCHYKAWRLAFEKWIRWKETRTSDMWADSSDSNKRARTSESEHSFNLDLNDDATDDANEETEFEVEPPPVTMRSAGRDKAKKAGKSVASEASEDPLVGTWKESVAFAKERSERKEKKRESMLEEQRKLWESQQQMIEAQNAQLEHQKRMWAKHDLLVEQQNETLKEQQLLASVDILCRVPDEGVDEESKREIELIKQELRARRAGRR
ncbi:hypothetical protein LXL04_024985 [Taraxacum kok-saghyz]